MKSPKVPPKPPIVYCDFREARSGRISALELLGADVKMRELEVADHVLSDRVGVEVKADDFISSLIQDRKLYGQIFDLMMSYKKPLLIIEGGIDRLYTERLIPPQTIRSVLQTIAISFRVPMLETKNPYETACTLYEIAEREQRRKTKRYFNPHGKRSHLGKDEQLAYFMCGMTDCDVGPDMAIKLLSHFGSVERIVFADVDDLTEIKGIGVPTAKKIVEFFTRKYNQKER
jgi:Fanconi anemia group M protein